MDYIKLGRLAISNGDYQEALNIFRRAWEVKKDAPSYMGYGVASFRLGDYPSARWAFYKALNFEPENKEAYTYLEKIEGIKISPTPPPPLRRESLFRTGRDYLEINEEGEWRKFFIKGMNLGLGLPGFFPGEFAIRKGTYLKWFTQMIEGGSNSVRVYTLQPPAFYEALYEVNSKRPRLYLMQGIWVKAPENNDFNGRAYLSETVKDISDAVDAVYGNITLPERHGYAHGAYTYDVSHLLSAFVLGREWESCSVKSFNVAMGQKRSGYEGKFLGIRNATPFEVWITGLCDSLQTHEHKGYNITHPLTVVNWPTLDPLKHHSESDPEEELKAQGLPQNTGECHEKVPSEDDESLDISKVRSKRGAGFFVTYHAYPYYPDFINNDFAGEEKPYVAYLKTLKELHKDQPVFIGEFGVPSSRETAHVQNLGWNHGGHTDEKKGEIDALLLEKIHEAGMAGGALFAWFDEWFKKNWVFLPYELPPERNNLWYNLQDPEQNYGLLAAYPGYPKKLVELAGRSDDWKTATTLYEKHGAPVFRFKDGGDGARTLNKLKVQHDEGFLYIKIETDGAVDFKKANYMIGLDTCAPAKGEFKLNYGTGVKSPVGLKFLITLTGKDFSRILVTRYYDKYLNMEWGIIRPELSNDGSWVAIHNKPNKRRLSKDFKTFYPARVVPMDALRYGSLDEKSPDYDSLADFFVKENSIELRIPWGLINFTDPSSKTVLWKDVGVRTKKTDGINVVAFSYKPEKGSRLAKETRMGVNITDSLPQRLTKEAVKKYTWEGWNTPIYHTSMKKSYTVYRDRVKKLPERP